MLAKTGNIRGSVTVTTLVCISADGRAMPSLFVVKGKTSGSFQPFATHDAPEGSVWTFQQDAWMDKANGLEWFKNVFLKHCGPERPQVLILDSHVSHEVVELFELARQENIHIMALPPHTTHFLQPLKRVVWAIQKRLQKDLHWIRVNPPKRCSKRNHQAQHNSTGVDRGYDIWPTEEGLWGNRHHTCRQDQDPHRSVCPISCCGLCHSACKQQLQPWHYPQHVCSQCNRRANCQF